MTREINPATISQTEVTATLSSSQGIKIGMSLTIKDSGMELSDWLTTGEALILRDWITTNFEATK